jgi:hypothetical protein
MLISVTKNNIVFENNSDKDIKNIVICFKQYRKNQYPIIYIQNNYYFITTTNKHILTIENISAHSIKIIPYILFRYKLSCKIIYDDNKYQLLLSHNFVFSTLTNYNEKIVINKHKNFSINGKFIFSAKSDGVLLLNGSKYKIKADGLLEKTINTDKTEFIMDYKWQSDNPLNMLLIQDNSNILSATFLHKWIEKKKENVTIYITNYNLYQLMNINLGENFYKLKLKFINNTSQGAILLINCNKKNIIESGSFYYYSFDMGMLSSISIAFNLFAIDNIDCELYSYDNLLASIKLNVIQL